MSLHKMQISIYINVCMKSVACCHTCTHVAKQCADNPFFCVFVCVCMRVCWFLGENFLVKVVIEVHTRTHAWNINLHVDIFIHDEVQKYPIFYFLLVSTNVDRVVQKTFKRVRRTALGLLYKELNASVRVDSACRDTAKVCGR